MKTEDHDIQKSDILIKISQIAGSNLEMKETLAGIARAITTTLNKDSCCICIVKPDDKLVCFEAVKENNKDSFAYFCLKTADNELIERVVKDRQPVIIEDVENSPLQADPIKLGFAKLNSMLAFPIIQNNTSIGVLILQTREPYSYSDDEKKLINLICYHISSAILNTELLENLEFQLNRLKLIHEVGKAITSILDIDDLLPFICREITGLFNVKGSILRLVEGDMLNIKASYGLPEEFRQDMSLNIGDGIAGKVAETGEHLVIDDLSEMPGNLNIPMVEATSVLCFPLKIGDKIIGTLGLYDKMNEWGLDIFSQNDINTLSTLASVSSIAIENANLYQAVREKEEDILSLYLDVNQTKNYLKSIIDNSADAIITSDIKGLITSWNRQAEIIYGFSSDEAIGNFLPMVPEDLYEDENRNIKMILSGETISNLETVRQKKDGTLIEISLTLSPINDSSGEVSGISGISRDISEKKRLEKELISRNEELSRLFFINSVVRSTLDLDKLLRMVLTVVTMGDGLGFNRALLFLVDRSKNILNGVMGVGPADEDEAASIWSRLENEEKTLPEMIEDIKSSDAVPESTLDRISRMFSITLDSDCILCKCINEKSPHNVIDVRNDPGSAFIVEELRTERFGIVPLIARDRAIGLILVDNHFTKNPITEKDLELLMEFTSNVASSIENARLFENVSMAESELSNIFESINDMIFFTDAESTIVRANKAVLKRAGMTESEIIGKKCYEIFHGSEQPKQCPQLKTLKYKEPFVEEIEEPLLGGIFVESCSPIFDLSGKMTGSVHISHDITEMNSLKERVSHSERMAALGELAAKVAHEIRNPLVSVGGFARRLKSSLSGESLEYASIIVTEVSKLEKKLKDILSFVKDPPVLRIPIDINQLVGDTINFVSNQITESGNCVVTDIHDSILMVLVDPDKIREALLNIITNACHATEDGTIYIKTGQVDEEAVIEISDTGLGIKEDHLSNIFDLFFTTKPDGSGLGLAVTHKIIEEHNGRITAGSTSIRKTSGEDPATVFQIFIPLIKKWPEV